MGAIIEKNYSYAAFISYAHADERAAKKLHGALETYPLPKDMRSWDKEPQNRAKLTPIFRDVTELTAHHSLSEKIRDAVKTSRFLIVLCSPAAKKSHWVNEEIRLFRSLHGESSILAVIVQGNPNTAFPPALTEAGREPLAADISGKEGFRFGVSQLAASMLGVGLDRLVQRDQRRRRIRTQAITMASTALAIVMGGLAYTAIDARDMAEVSQTKAEVSRNAAEEMVEFMIKDLKEDLVPIQKLELFDNVGKRVTEYYDAIPLEDMDDDRLMRQARARHILGEVALNQGDYERAEKELQAAYDASKTVLDKYPDNTDAIFTHAQSEYWNGEAQFKQRKYFASLPFKEAYTEMSRTLHRLDPQNMSWLVEAGWASDSFAINNVRIERYDAARQSWLASNKFFEIAIAREPENWVTKKYIANNYSGLSQLEQKVGNEIASLNYQEHSASLFGEALENDPDNNDLKYRYLQALHGIVRLKANSFCDNPNVDTVFYGMLDLIKHDDQNLTWRKFYFYQWRHLLLACSDHHTKVLEKHSRDYFYEEANKFASDKYIQRQISYVQKANEGEISPPK